MEGDTPPEEATLFPATVGEKLRAAREAQGIDLSDIAARTRIPQRHLEAIEKSNYSSLPSITYALGFAKAYARAVGTDEVEIARALRFELDTKFERVQPTPPYEMSDPTRTPPRGLMWIGLVIAALLLAGAGIWYGTDLLRGTAPPPETLELPEETPTPDAADAAAAGQVRLTALDTVWVHVTDASGKTLYGREMKAGESYDVPPDADHPLARTVRPDAIQVTVNGSNVPALGPAGKDTQVEVSAAALLARGAGTPGATPTPGATSTPGALPSATGAATQTPRRRTQPQASAPRPTPEPAAPAPEPATVNTVAQ
jgi:cytoskeleton protein RodZ